MRTNKIELLKEVYKNFHSSLAVATGMASSIVGGLLSLKYWGQKEPFIAYLTPSIIGSGLLGYSMSKGISNIVYRIKYGTFEENIDRIAEKMIGQGLEGNGEFSRLSKVEQDVIRSIKIEKSLEKHHGEGIDKDLSKLHYDTIKKEVTQSIREYLDNVGASEIINVNPKLLRKKDRDRYVKHLTSELDPNKDAISKLLPSEKGLDTQGKLLVTLINESERGFTNRVNKWASQYFMGQQTN